jgi:aspartyl-tRNA(Asn)/glutamyl-tRNA(Gln) amidotransferase subunit A
VHVVAGYRERIDRLHDRLYASVTVCRAQAVEAARGSEQALARGASRGPCHGVPVAVKDQRTTAGIRTTCGTPIVNACVPAEDATVIAKLKAAGAILLGQLKMTAFGTHRVSHTCATARNPWDRECCTSMSSSGSGGATAAFLCATALGEDTGGTVRGPAAWCRVVGLRPTWGRVSRHGLRPGLWSMDTIGPRSCTVEDCALILQAIAGHDPHDAYTCLAGRAHAP